MSEEIRKIAAGYTVLIELDGTITTHALPADEQIERQATTMDIYATSKELATNVETFLLADRVAQAVVQALQPVNPTSEMKEKIREALSDRGIETPVVE
jgi:galactitol-specific phosphotransferase system IIB component